MTIPNESADMYNSVIALRSGLNIYPSQGRAIDRVLLDMLQNIPAHFVLLCDVSGQIVAIRGEHSGLDPLALGALTASDLAASQEIARILGEYQAYQIALREGQNSNIFVAGAGLYLALLVQVDASVPLGWARMLILKSAKQLASIVDTVPDELKNASEHQNAMQQEVDVLSGDDGLADLFGDALDDLWSE